MPCRDYVDDTRIVTEYRDNPETKKRLDRVTRLLCFVIRNLTPLEKNHLFGHKSNGQDLKKWWITHQKQDKLRLQKEKEKREHKKIKTKALAKLTPKEKRALGLT